MTSVVTLGVFLIPLIAVLISYDAFVGEQEHGTLILLLTYPLSRTALLTGKLLGQSAALGVCLLLGFSVLPLLTVLNVLPYDLTRLSLLTAVLIFSGCLLGLVFILISLTISLLAKNKARALGVLLSIWLLSVLFYDLGLLIITIAFEHQIRNEFLNICLAANPASAFRLFNQQLLENSTIPLQTAWLGVYLCLWSAVLFVLDRFILNKELSNQRFLTKGALLCRQKLVILFLLPLRYVQCFCLCRLYWGLKAEHRFSFIFGSRL